jgi:ubiquitin C-terminal hydrolase
VREETYNLKSVVCHIGSTANSGHYTADAIRVSESKRSATWVSFDDGMTSVTSTEQVIKDEKNQRTAYMLLYTLD